MVLQREGSVSYLDFLRLRTLHYALSSPFSFSRGGRGKTETFKAIKSSIAGLLLLFLVRKLVILSDAEKYA